MKILYFLSFSFRVEEKVTVILKVYLLLGLKYTELQVLCCNPFKCLLKNYTARSLIVK